MPLNYKRPKTLEKLVQLDQELHQLHGQTVNDYIGFYISFNNDDDRYECTPEDAVVFGRTGVGADHFAFYTFNQSLKDLEEAPIIFIQPMFEKTVHLVARNLRDFLALFITLKEIYVLERFEYYKGQSDFIKDYNENYLKDIDSRESEFQFLLRN
ncbi:hypothetical protein [Paenibacillus sp. NPDC093718]|uniref:hypothetical protein n=1 Tax=Paenibacillus sp. NPDC093718 TaxID=3390601 RepID=UPI003D054D8C